MKFLKKKNNKKFKEQKANAKWNMIYDSVYINYIKVYFFSLTFNFFCLLLLNLCTWHLGGGYVCNLLVVLRIYVSFFWTFLGEAVILVYIYSNKNNSKYVNAAPNMLKFLSFYKEKKTFYFSSKPFILYTHFYKCQLDRTSMYTVNTSKNVQNILLCYSESIKNVSKSWSKSETRASTKSSTDGCFCSIPRKYQREILKTNWMLLLNTW